MNTPITTYDNRPTQTMHYREYPYRIEFKDRDYSWVWVVASFLGILGYLFFG